jgi:hypothetical protein
VSISPRYETEHPPPQNETYLLVYHFYDEIYLIGCFPMNALTLVVSTDILRLQLLVILYNSSRTLCLTIITITFSGIIQLYNETESMCMFDILNVMTAICTPPTRSMAHKGRWFDRYMNRQMFME